MDQGSSLCFGKDEDWSLYAVVRQGSRGLTAPQPQADLFFQEILQTQEEVPYEDQWQLQAVVNMQASLDPVPTSFSAPQLPQQQAPPVLEPSVSGGGSSLAPKRSRTRKNNCENMGENEVVVLVRAEDFPFSDKLGWRKYGQKPIKGIPYPRAYYRCNSYFDTGCPARKTMERSVQYPGFLVVAYTDEHNHEEPQSRNVLASQKHRVAHTQVGAGSSSSSQAPAPAAVYPPAPQCTTKFNEFNAEKEEEDALALQYPIDNAAMAHEELIMFPALDSALVSGGGQDNLPLPVPEGTMTVSEDGIGPEQPLPNVDMNMDDTFFASESEWEWYWEWEAARNAASRRSE